MRTLKYTTVTGNLGKIVKPPTIFLLFGLMGFTFLAEAQAPYSGWVSMKADIERQIEAMRGIKSSPEDWTDRIITGPGGGRWANRPVRRTGPTYYYLNPAPRVPRYYPKFNTPSYTAPNYTPQLQSGRTLQWKTGAGQQYRLDRLYVGRDANLVLKAFGRPDKVSWQHDTWTYQNLNIQNPSTRRQYRNVTFTVKNGKIKVASVH